MKTIEGVELKLGECKLMPIIYKDYSFKEVDELATAGALQPNLGCHPCGVTEEILAKAWRLRHRPTIHEPNIFTIITNKKIEQDRKKMAERYEKILMKIKPENYND